MTGWTKERVTRLRALLDEGLSAAQIAPRLFAEPVAKVEQLSMLDGAA